jgi:dCMP deaminase
MENRISKKDYFLQMLDAVASRSTCIRRAVGAIITDRDGHILSTGYNGVPRDFDHCIVNPCLGANDAAGNTSNCMAVHAEQNAILFCRGLPDAFTIYCSCVPCFTCAKLIANTNIQHVVCKYTYADKRGIEVLVQAGICVEVSGIVFDDNGPVKFEVI